MSENETTEPTVSLIYNTGRSPVTPGVPADFHVSVEMYNEAYTQKWRDLTSFEQDLRAAHPEMNDEQVTSEINDHLLKRMTMLENLLAIHKLEWVMSWRVFEDRLKVASDAERTRVRKSDSEHRSTVTGEVARVRRAKAVTHVPANPEEKREMAIKLMMDRMKLTREEAMDRLRIVLDVQQATAAPIVETPVVKVEEEPQE